MRTTMMYTYNFVRRYASKKACAEQWLFYLSQCASRHKADADAVVLGRKWDFHFITSWDLGRCRLEILTLSRRSCHSHHRAAELGLSFAEKLRYQLNYIIISLVIVRHQCHKHISGFSEKKLCVHWQKKVLFASLACKRRSICPIINYETDQYSTLR